MLSIDYIIGLTDGEGCFYVNIRHGNKTSLGQVETHFYIKMKDKEKQLLDKVKKTLGFGAIYFQNEKRKNHCCCYRYEVNNRKDINKLISIFQKNPLQSRKQNDFKLFCQVVDIINKKEHLTSKGLIEIKDLKSKMNK